MRLAGGASADCLVRHVADASREPCRPSCGAGRRVPGPPPWRRDATAMVQPRGSPGGFFANADFDYEARIVLGAVASGVGDVGLVLAALDQIDDGDPPSWFDAWTATAAELAARGDEALRRGHPATATWAFLAAAEYYAKALVFVDGLADQSVLLPTFREHRGCWEKVVDAAQGRYVRVPVPYEGTTLP